MALKHILSWLLQNKIFFQKNIKYYVVFYVFLFSFNCLSQIANYVSNGGFENLYSCTFPNKLVKVKYWNSLDSITVGASLFSTCPNYANVPLNSAGYQVPKSGENYVVTEFFCQANFCSNTYNRFYLKNRLKQPLQAGKTYCVKFYLVNTNNTSCGIDRFEAYFGDTSLDTITKCQHPLTYLNPQIQNPTNNIVTDTLNWTAITGTFVATGNEKYMVIGNFKSDAMTNTVIINPNNLPAKFTDIYIDDVSCIDIDLPAYAGPNIYGIPNNTVYIGRPRDVGIDESCMWYHLPNLTTAIDTAAGLTVTVGTVTNTYAVRQEICGNVKWDTVVVYASGVGYEELKSINERLKIYPNPADKNITIELEVFAQTNFKLQIFNNLNQLLREEDINFNDNKFDIKTDDLKSGFYFLSIKNDKFGTTSKKFVVAH